MTEVPNHENSTAQFFLVVLPGFEPEALRELKLWLPNLTNAKVEHGGIEFEIDREIGLSLNRYLKVPTRILMRLADFGCRDFPKLYKKMRNFPWAEKLGRNVRPVFQASATNSRLRMKKRIESTCTDGWKASFTGELPTKEARILVRVKDDVVWMSLDTSGEILHKRGLRQLTAEAPIRETTAAGLLYFMKSFGMESTVELVDPMMGGGTFLLEAAGMFDRVDSREFQLANTEVNLEKPGETSFASFIGYERDQKTQQAAAANLKTTKSQIVGTDFFEAAPLPIGPKRWLITNPPYGERLRVEGRLSDYYAKLFEKAEQVVRPERALFVLPEKVNPQRLRRPPSWKVLGEKRFLNGGYPVVALVCGRESLN